MIDPSLDRQISILVYNAHLRVTSPLGIEMVIVNKMQRRIRSITFLNIAKVLAGAGSK